ncbi:MAG TPA: hypothetical protein VK172_02345 [Lentimicrobium sp.]|nr:hypothetical protein [Lentimicrobium sp.]
MNRSIKTLLAFMLLSLVTSCALDEDIDPIDQDARDKFVGTWLFIESDAARGMSYSVNIALDNSNSSQVVLKNIGNFGNSYSAKGIVTSSTIYISSQEIYPGITIEGQGQLTSENEMDWSYTITGGGSSESYTATATR